MKSKLNNILNKYLLKEKCIPWILLLITIVVGLQEYFLIHTHLKNNHIIFTNSFFHLINYQDLYALYPSEYVDVFLYSPTFALLMAPFALAPVWLKPFLWSGVNSLGVYFAIKLLPINNNKNRVWLLYFIIFEFITSIQISQINALVAALIILSFVFFERKQVFIAAFFIALTFYVKIFGIGAAILFLFYPQKPKFILSMIFWLAVFWLAPLIVVSFDQLIYLYKQWFSETMAVHQSQQTGIDSNIANPLSVMNWLKTWFNISLPILAVQLTGAAILCIPLLKIKSYSNLNFRLFFLSSILIWVIIFNHIAEPASYIIAIFGVAIWFLMEDKNKFSITLFVLAILFTSLSPTDLFPKYLRVHFVAPYLLKGVPCMFIWFFLQYKLIFKKI